MEDEKNEELEETSTDRRMRYKKLVAGGMRDRQAMEKVWPTSDASIAKNKKDKEDKENKA